jgi:DNA-binding NarL/FixJ family response regulator
MINETAGMQSVGTPGELRRALTLVETARPDAVVVELGQGRAATLNACRDLRRRFPRVTIVALGTSEDPAVVNEALAAGVRGYLDDQHRRRRLLGWAILAARAGRPTSTRRSPPGGALRRAGTPSRSHAGDPPDLRRRGRRARRAAQGQSNRQIGRNLFISEDTVKSHVKAILRKLGARDRAHASRWCCPRGARLPALRARPPPPCRASWPHPASRTAAASSRSACGSRARPVHGPAPLTPGPAHGVPAR